MATEKTLKDLTDRELMERIADNTRKSAETLIRIKNYVILIILLGIMIFAIGLVYFQHN